MADTYDRTKFLTVSVSDDHMRVYLSVKPFAQENIDIKVDDVLKFLKTKTIASAINEELIKTTLDKVKQENFLIENILISEGTTVIHGDDGKLEFLFNADKKIKPHKDAGGKVDFHNLSIVDSVEKEQPLVKLIGSSGNRVGKNAP
ncbi:MAG: polymerase [Candidatus Brocadiaceae bacterium]|nr:polymerase [Candidatus Brocadiaceae bacterium]